MQKILIYTLLILAYGNLMHAQSTKQIGKKKVFAIGLGMGAGILHLKDTSTSQSSFTTSLPNIKVGLMIHKRLGLFALLPGANYKLNGKDRGFEAFLITGQYWLKSNWWLLGGIGITFDAPAFYTVKDPKTAGFFTGFPAVTAATGYEIWHRRRFTLDVQYRWFVGQSNLPNNNQRNGISNLFLIGFNWY